MESNEVSLVDSSKTVHKEQEFVEKEIPAQNVSTVDEIQRDSLFSTSDDNEALLPVNDSPMDFTNITIPNQDVDMISRLTVKRVGWRRYIGIMFALTASALHTLASLIAKIMTDKKKTKNPYHPITVAVWRFQGIFWPTFVVLLYYSIYLKKDVLKAFKPVKKRGKWKLIVILILRGIFGVSGNIFHYYSFRYLELGDASVIVTSTPVFVTFAAYLLLKEPCGIVPVLCGFIALCGKGISYSFSSMIASTMVYVSLRRIRAIHYTVIITASSFFGSIVCLILTTVIHPLETPREGNHWLLVVAFALLTCVSQCCITLALKYEQAGPVSLIRTSDVIFAFIWQGIFLSIAPDKYSYIGAVIVIIAVLICGLRKWIGELPEDNAARKKLSFLLA